VTAHNLYAGTRVCNSPMRSSPGVCSPKPIKGARDFIIQSAVRSEEGRFPGVYGVECSADGKPFINVTYDVF